VIGLSLRQEARDGFPHEIIVFAVAPDRQQPGYWLPRTH